jgi:hypothetical protein
MDAGAHSGIDCETTRYYALDRTDYHGSQLISVISLLSSDTPNLDSPANVDAAKEVRTDIESKRHLVPF